jgi:RNA polymerase sigma-70 factor, ECF subfamily
MQSQKRNLMKEQQAYFMSLLEPVYDDVVRYIRAMTRNAEDTRDVLGETLLTAFEHFGELRNSASFKFFMITIARRVFSRTIWKQKLFAHVDRKTMESFWDPMAPPDLAPDIALLYEMLRRIPLKQRDAIVLFELQGFSIQEIRDLQGGSISGVKMRLSRARRQLEELLRENEPARDGKEERFISIQEADA